MKERIGLIECVRFIGEEGEQLVEVKCDTGAKRTSVCYSLGEKIGLGNPVKNSNCPFE